MRVPLVGDVMRPWGCGGLFEGVFKVFCLLAGVSIAVEPSVLIAKLVCCVPFKNHSWRAASGSPNGCLGRGVALNRTAVCTSPLGAIGARLACDWCRWFIMAAHTGAAPVLPLTSRMGEPLALPTHTPTV